MTSEGAHKDFKSGATARLSALDRAALLSGRPAAGLRVYPSKGRLAGDGVAATSAVNSGGRHLSEEERHRLARYSHPHLSSSEGRVPLASLTAEEEANFDARGVHGASLRRDRLVLCFDADCFYAQVEEALEPRLRGCPLGVTQKNIIVTCNYAARAYGVTKLMYIAKALSLCPALALRSGEDLTHYRAASERIMEAVVCALGGGDAALGPDEAGGGLRGHVLAATRGALRHLAEGGSSPQHPACQRQGLDEIFVEATPAASALLSDAGLLAWREHLAQGLAAAGAPTPAPDELARALRPAHVVEWPPGGGALDEACAWLGARLAPRGGAPLAAALAQVGSGGGGSGNGRAGDALGTTARTEADARAGGAEEGAGVWGKGAEEEGRGEDEENDEDEDDDFVEGEEALSGAPARAEGPQSACARASAMDSAGAVGRRVREGALLVVGDALAALARARVRAALGFSLCAGAAGSKLLSKFAVNLRKPDAQTALHGSAVRPFLYSLPLRRVPGVGHASAKRLAAEAGAQVVRDLLPMPLDALERVLGRRTARLVYLSVRGIDDEPVRPAGAPRSLSVEDSFKAVTDMAGVRAYLVALAGALVRRVCEDARRNARAPKTLAVRFRHVRQRAQSRQWPSPPQLRAEALRARRGKRERADAQCEKERDAEGARAAVVRGAVAQLQRALAGEFHLTLLGLACPAFEPLGGGAPGAVEAVAARSAGRGGGAAGIERFVGPAAARGGEAAPATPRSDGAGVYSARGCSAGGSGGGGVDRGGAEEGGRGDGAGAPDDLLGALCRARGWDLSSVLALPEGVRRDLMRGEAGDAAQARPRAPQPQRARSRIEAFFGTKAPPRG